MTDTVKFSCQIDSTDYSVPLQLKIKLNDSVMFDTVHVDRCQTVEFVIAEDREQHTMVFEMSGKNPEHTVVDSNGEIVKDAMLSVTQCKMEDILMDRAVQDNAVYHHDFNGSQSEIQDRFYGNMGCNGTVMLEFSSPMVLWLLEKTQ